MTTGITINGSGTYTKAQPVVGLDFPTQAPGRLFASATRPTVPVRMIVIVGIPSSVPGAFAGKQGGSSTQFGFRKFEIGRTQITKSQYCLFRDELRSARGVNSLPAS